MRRDTIPPHQSRCRHPRLRRTGELVAFAALAAVLFLTWPQSLGGRVAYIMVSGHSMEPTMHLGDLVVLREQPAYRVGEIVAYHVPDGEVGAGAIVIHRIVAGNAQKGFTTRGDNNSYRDAWHPHTTNILGARWTVLPGAANVFTRLRSPFALATFSAILTALVAYELLKPRGRHRTTPARRRRIRRTYSEEDPSPDEPARRLNCTPALDTACKTSAAPTGIAVASSEQPSARVGAGIGDPDGAI